MVTIVLIHGGVSTVAKIQQIMPDARVAVIYAGAGKLSSGYDEATGIAAEFPTLRGLMAHYVPDWKPGDPLVLIGYSAGGWALRYYLRDPDAREEIAAAIFLDSTYGNSGEQCTRIDAYQGVIEYGRLANARPSQKRLLLTYSYSHPGPRVCASAIVKAIGPGDGVFVRDFQTDHGSMQGVVGPKMIAEYIQPWIGGVRGGSGLSKKTAVGMLLLASGAGLIYMYYTS